MHESGTRSAGRGGALRPITASLSRTTFSMRARLPGRSCMQLKITYDVRHPASQPCARWLAGRSHAFIQPASRARASCMKTLDALRSDHGWLDGWMDGWMHAPARARMHPASQPRAHMHNACRLWMHSDQIMHCMHAEPRGSQITGRYMHSSGINQG